LTVVRPPDGPEFRRDSKKEEAKLLRPVQCAEVKSKANSLNEKGDSCLNQDFFSEKRS